MRRFSVVHLVIAALILFSVGCSSSNKGKIEGTKWSCRAGVVKGINVPAGILKLEFNKDGTMVYRTGPQTFTGKYSLGMGSYVTLNLDRELAGKKIHVEEVTINGNELSMTDLDGTHITFNKVP